MRTDLEAPMVEVIIVTWNKKEDVTRLLKQLRDIDYPENRFEITVVDNNSTDGTVDAIDALYPSVNLMRNRENLGGAGGFNAGMRWVLKNRPSCEYMWLLDNDVLVDKNALKELVAVMNSDPEAAVCGSRIMDIADYSEVLEVGAFIDYSLGDIRRNIPDRTQLEDPHAIFQVDYVAGCSLLARSEYVRLLGVWHGHLFVYWDDIEWGARFNAFGYKVLASNASIVYHPSWAGRTVDSSAVWRCYYRARNSLWFFNNHTTGLRRRLLLALMIVRFMKFATGSCLAARSCLSHAFLNGIEDFFLGCYGEKEFRQPAYDFAEYLEGTNDRDVCVFLFDSRTAQHARRYVCELMKKCPGMRVRVVVPKANVRQWEGFCDKDDIVVYTRSRNGAIPWGERLRIVRFLRNRSWDVLLTPPLTPRIGAIWGKDVARVDFARGSTIAIEKLKLRDLCRITIMALYYVLRVFLFLPKKDMARVENRREKWSEG